MSTPHPGSEHLIILPDRQVAEEIAAELRGEGFEHVRVAATNAPGQGREPGQDGDVRPVQWVVHVLDTRLPDTAGGAAYEALRERFAALARQNHGRYDEPGDPRPPVG